MAADIYLEAMTCRDVELGDCWSRKWRRHVKANVVKWVKMVGFFHRWSVNRSIKK
jgi:uncharacterized membrane protein